MSVAAPISLADFVTAIQNRSNSKNTYAVTPNPGSSTVGTFTITRNGANLWSFTWSPLNVAGGVMGSTGAGTDANPSGVNVALIAPDGTSAKTDVVTFLQSLN